LGYIVIELSKAGSAGFAASLLSVMVVRVGGFIENSVHLSDDSYL
jgi:hypothetical protein